LHGILRLELPFANLRRRLAFSQFRAVWEHTGKFLWVEQYQWIGRAVVRRERP
jgi:hypothetical protein